jgi:hypothetical protein
VATKGSKGWGQCVEREASISHAERFGCGFTDQNLAAVCRFSDGGIQLQPGFDDKILSHLQQLFALSPQHQMTLRERTRNGSIVLPLYSFDIAQVT